MISLEKLFSINRFLIEEFGGMSVGFKDENLVMSLVEGVNQEVFGKILYPTVYDRISYIVFSIISNQVFLDGNKRTGIYVLEYLCEKENLVLDCSDDNLIELARSIDKSEISIERLSSWLKDNSCCLDKKENILSDLSFFGQIEK